MPTSPPIRAVDSPLPTDDLRHHPFFRFEYALPADDWIESEMARRRTRDTPSPPSSRPPSPPPTKRPRGGGRGRGRRGGLAAAGLVAGDSDSSALTDDSPDEDGASVAPTVTGTDGGTEDVDEEEEETEGSPGQCGVVICRPSLTLPHSTIVEEARQGASRGIFCPRSRKGRQKTKAIVLDREIGFCSSSS